MTKIEREVISAKISKESLAGWKKFCVENGISMSALLEVAGLHLAEETCPPSAPQRVEMVNAARAIDIKRRARR